MVITYLDVLFMYILDLLISDNHRPLRWRIIDTASPFFKSRVACMEGYEEILQIAGYTVKKGTSLMIPEDVLEPDKAKLSILAAELLMAKLEVKQMKSAAVKQKHETADSAISTGTLVMSHDHPVLCL